MNKASFMPSIGKWCGTSFLGEKYSFFGKGDTCLSCFQMSQSVSCVSNNTVCVREKDLVFPATGCERSIGQNTWQYRRALRKLSALWTVSREKAAKFRPIDANRAPHLWLKCGALFLLTVLAGIMLKNKDESQAEKCG